MNIIYSTIELSSYMTQPWKTIGKVWEFIRLIPDDQTHICMSITKPLKDYFSPEAKGQKIIAYKHDGIFWVDLYKEDLKLEDIKNKPCLKVEITGGKVKIRI